MHYIFFGSSEFSQRVLANLVEAGKPPFLVITTPAKAAGRKKNITPSAVQIYTEKIRIQTLAPDNLKDKNFIEEFRNYKPDFVFLTAYGKIIPSVLLKIPSFGFLNLHPSLLPYFRGATPIQSVILAGEKETGATIFLMDEALDHGPILFQEKYKLEDKKITAGELSEKLADLGTELFLKNIAKWLKKEIIPQPQNEAQATYCSKIAAIDERIDWQREAETIERQVRALNPQPEALTFSSKGVIKILQGFSCEDSSLTLNKKPGETFIFENKLAIKCGKGFYAVEKLKPAGKKIMPSNDFLLGNQWILKEILS
ncbi:MAG: methionyl-tRNA formyltransferase [Candidatus Paceibacterota bacterium]|jgi:methionyl-tRNA formyltransferase|nr:methionyl-tRNA formyltransferase [Candidatus Paceibacterota bacterium]MDD3548571.1 methionyl-tRNA formyltransferase [Candidatus Paceibacterota bacterium]MDD4999046.1 methionyl-tRNA formyltransferase [Candidatus Paceibacterota bacterium]MDD5545177.1 methionyl-tRNA formyltransferase [Candidatus Paceibacterota bacterium]